MGAPQPELAQDRLGRRWIDREPRPHRVAGGIVHLVDQAGDQLDELAFLIGRMGARLHIEVGQDAQQGRADVDALATGECHQPVETLEITGAALMEGVRDFETATSGTLRTKLRGPL